MSRILEIAGDGIALAFVLGVGVWLFIRALKRSIDPSKQIFKAAASLIIIVGEVFFARHAAGTLGPGDPLANIGATMTLVISIAITGVILGVIWARNIAELVAKPLTSMFDGGNEPPEPKPYYSTAQAKRKRHEFLQAVVAIREQLAKFPNDYEGIMLLAAIQAEDLQDLPSAEITLNHFCDQPDAPTRQFAAAMNQLADWHIKLAQDFESARAALERIIARFPETEPSLQAAQRIARLGGTEKQMRVALDRQPMPVPEGVKNVGLLASSEHLRPDEPDPSKLAAAYVKHLEQHPLDTQAREELAVIYADHYQRLDMATGELNQLIETPNQPAKKVAHWLNLLADLQVRHGADYDTVRETLERIIVRFSDLAAGEMARTRLAKLKLEIKGHHQETPDVKLGVYEQNIGLRSGPRRQL
jgi:tetratricopeptide (TPR) repeat protein